MGSNRGIEEEVIAYHMFHIIHLQYTQSMLFVSIC